MNEENRAARSDAEFAAAVAPPSPPRRSAARVFRRPKRAGNAAADTNAPGRTSGDGTPPAEARSKAGVGETRSKANFGEARTGTAADDTRTKAEIAKDPKTRADAGSAPAAERTAADSPTNSHHAEGAAKSAPGIARHAEGAAKKARTSAGKRNSEAMSFARTYAPAAAYFAFTAILSATPFTYDTYPFGTALFCAACGTRYAVAALLGLTVGSVFAEGGAYVTLVALVIAAARVAIGAQNKRRVIRFASLSAKAPSGDVVFTGEAEHGEPEATPGAKATPTDAARPALTDSAKPRPKSADPQSGAHDRPSAFSFAEDVPVRCALAAGGAMITGGIGMLFHQSVWRGVAAMVLCAAVAPLLCAAFSGFFRRRSRTAFLSCLAATAFSVSWLLSGVSIASFGVGPAFALLISFAAAHFLALPEALAASLVVSLPLEFALIPAIMLATGAYSLVRRQFPTLASTAGAATALFFSLGALGMTAASRYGAEFLVASALCVALTRSASRLPEYLSPRAFARLRELFGAFPAEAEPNAEGERAVGELRTLAECFTALGEMAKSVAKALAVPSEAELRERVERSFSRKCADCRRREECVADGETLEYRRRLARALKTGRGVSAAAVPQSLSVRCAELASILRSISPREADAAATDECARDLTELGALLKSSSERLDADSVFDAGAARRLRQELAAAGVFADEVSVVSPRLRLTHIRGVEPSSLHAGAHDLREWVERSLGVEMTEPKIALSPDGTLDVSMHAKERYRVVMGKCSLSASASACGDSASAFVSRDGYFRALISDGMGSGTEAAFTAGTVTLFLERMLASGVDMSAALRITNSFLRRRRIECSATVDAAQIDLVRGGASFFKSGAAPSFVLRSGKLFALRSKTVPIGILPAADAEGISFEAEAGDVIMMASDGVTRDGGECPWLCEALCRESMANLTAAAKRIASEARRRCEDDVTVLLLRIEQA